MIGKILKTSVDGTGLNKLGVLKIELVEDKSYFFSISGAGTVLEFDGNGDMKNPDTKESYGKRYTISSYINIEVHGIGVLYIHGYSVSSITQPVINTTYSGKYVNAYFSEFEYRSFVNIQLYTRNSTSIENLKTCDRLKSVKLHSNNNLSGKIEELAVCSSLTELIVHDTQVTGSVNKFLENLWIAKGKSEGSLKLDVGGTAALFNGNGMLGEKTVTFTSNTIVCNGSTFDGTTWS